MKFYLLVLIASIGFRGNAQIIFGQNDSLRNPETHHLPTHPLHANNIFLGDAYFNNIELHLDSITELIRNRYLYKSHETSRIMNYLTLVIHNIDGAEQVEVDDTLVLKDYLDQLEISDFKVKSWENDAQIYPREFKISSNHSNCLETNLLFHEKLDRTWLSKFRTNWSAGLSVGYFQFLAKPSIYHVTDDERLVEYKLRGGLGLALSGHLTYEIYDDQFVLLSLPLLTLTAQSESKIGLISSRPAMGLGYGVRAGDMALYISLISAPFDEIDVDAIKSLQSKHESFKRIELEDLPKQTRYIPAISFGLMVLLD